MTPVEPRAGRSRTTWLAVALLAALAYVPALASSPGKMPADTKLYLYLNPARLISDAPYTFDARQFAGWVPHQVIAYLWPQGPWFWLGDTVRLPDWVVHRLWIGTLMFLAGAGVLWLCRRRFGLGVLASLAAAIVYQLSPYLLPYVSRTSAMLLPWAGLGWLVGLTMGAALRTRWRDAALAALVVVSIGAVNATAIMMIIPGPLLWLVVAALERQVAWRRAVAAALRIGVLAAGVSLWWIGAVSIQGKLGADVLSYSESLKAVSFTSTSTEVWRGLGYWLTYIRDPYAATTTAGADYMTSSKVILAGFLLLILGVAGLVAVRWRQRRYAIALVVTGVVLGVGVHPIDHPSPLMRVLRGDGESGLALALRSSTRAVPVLALGLGLGIAMVVQVLPAWRRSTADAAGADGREPHTAWAGRVPWRALATAGVLVLALVNLPVLTHHALVDPALERDEQPPAAWTEAAAALDAAPPGYRVMELPGAEFGAFRWGYTVDPPLPGLTDRPLVTRDLLPLGSAGAMDLLYALDDRFQAGVAETGEVAPVARLLGADTIWLPGDAAFDRFRTPRPEITHAQFAAAAAATEGLGMPVPYGPPAPNPPNVPMVDEQSLSDPRVGQPVPPVELVPVQDPEAVIRAKDRSVLIDGSGDGIVDSAAAGLLDGRELIRYAASLSGHDLAVALRDADQVLITDSNRDRAHHWRGSQDVSGFTESGGPGSDVLDVDEGDQRLPVFTNDSARTQTIAVQEGPATAIASSYGEPFAYRPEDRPFMAVDGDPTTAWLVADRAPAEGQRIRFRVAEPIDHVTLHQPQGAGAVRHLGAVTIAVDDRAPQHVTLDEQSLSAGGQRVDLDPTSGPSTVTITIDGVVVADPTLGPASAAVGFSEVDFGLGPTIEVVRPPVVVTSAMTSGGTATPVTYVLTRLRTRPTDRWRSDPEAAMVREITVPAEQAFTPTVTVRLDQRATDAVLAGLLGITGAQGSARLTGATSAAGWSATDGDATTAWITPFGQAVGSTLEADAPTQTSDLVVTQRAGDYSPITALRLTSGPNVIDAEVPPPGADGVSRVNLPTPLPAGPVQVQITAIDPRTTIDRRYGEPVQLPAAIAELSLGPATTVPAQLDTGCRDDLVRIDGQPLPLRVQAAVPALLAGDAVTATPCGATELTLEAGTHRITTTPGAESGLQVDRIVLAGPSPAAAAPATGAAPAAGVATGPTATVTSSSRLSRKVTVDQCPKGCWLVLGEGFHDSWSATTATGSLGPPTLVDGGFNGWRIPPSDGPTEVTLHWTSQRPLTIAIVLSGLAVLAAIALAILDRRRQPLPVYALPRLGFPGAAAPRPALVAGAVVWVAAAGLLVGPAWMLAAAVGSTIVLGVLRRPRLAGVVTVGILAFSAVVVVYVVRNDQPFPNAGWPVRFDWLHGLGLFAAVSLLPAAAGWPRRPRPASAGSGQPSAPPGGDPLTRTADSTDEGAE